MANQDKPIIGKSVLVTRPQEQAQGLLTLLSQLGAQTIAMPLLEIEPAELTQSERQIAIDLDHYDLVVVISANAANLAMALFDNYWPQLPAHIAWYAVGGATANALRGHGVVPSTPPGLEATSETLLALPGMSDVTGKRALIAKGEGGRELLRQALQERGARVDELKLYRRKPAYYSPEQVRLLLGDGLPDIIVVTSAAILENMHRLLSPCYPDLIGVNLVAASGRIAEMACNLGYRKVVVAEGASDQALVDAMVGIE